MADELSEIKSDVAVLQTEVASAHHRIDKVEKLTDSIAAIATEIKYMRESQDSIKKDIEELKKRPSAMWDKIIAAAIGAVATGLVGAIFTLILK